jgi:hypothetical protein
MKLIYLMVLLIFSGAALISRAQDAAQSTVDLQTQRNQPETPTATPVNPPEVPELSKLDEAFKQTSLGKAADEYRNRLEWRKLQNETARDPAVVTAKMEAEAARTDLEKREWLRNYYNLYYGRMRARASSEEMKKALDFEKGEHLKLLNQPRVRHATDGSLPTPTPSKEEHRKRKR